MKYFTIILGSVGFISALIFSYANCVLLFQSMDFFTGWKAYVASLMVGLVAISGAVIIVSNRMKGISSGIFSWVAVAVGITCATLGGVLRGWDYGMTGILVNIGLTPLCLVILAVNLAIEIIQGVNQRTDREQQ
ncbi:hypothetical protein ACFQ40_11695 [Kroppenstedtia eburnea]|uniref:hypothetical protein n=1 Tax=Kroppenstedtia eburnea TaxID=714067 RepID=UPI003645EF60